MAANRPGSARQARGPGASRFARAAGDLPELGAVARACLLGGAVGDALGAEVEFVTMGAIRQRFGPGGIRGFGESPGHMTDDTQMTLFTADALIRLRMGSDRGSEAPAGEFHRSYLRWLSTQGEPAAAAGRVEPGGWLASHPQLQVRRAPGNTCLSALSGGRPGSPDDPINDSKGCGGVMRVAPIGLVADEPFRVAVAAAAVTHTNPSGYLPAGALAEILARLRRGESLLRGVAAAQRRLVGWSGNAETADAIDAAVELATSTPVATPEALSTLGEGWVGEEALAIALYCALTASDFASGVIAAVNHSGDSDSTGAITGNLLGARFGPEALPPEWVDALAEGELVATVASDLAAAYDGSGGDDLAGRYG